MEIEEPLIKIIIKYNGKKYGIGVPEGLLTDDMIPILAKSVERKLKQIQEETLLS
jgi:hypothetical protein